MIDTYMKKKQKRELEYVSILSKGDLLPTFSLSV